MTGDSTNRLETTFENVAAMLFGASVGYAIYLALPPIAGQPELTVCAVAAAIAAQLLCAYGLRLVDRAQPQFKLAAFEAAPIQLSGDDELLLTTEDRLPSPITPRMSDFSQAAEPLELDDVLAEPSPDSRVVRLFDRSAMPAARRLPETPADASAALSAALAQLRQSLR